MLQKEDKSPRDISRLSLPAEINFQPIKLQGQLALDVEKP